MHLLAEKYNAPQLLEVLPIYFFTNLILTLFFHFNFVQQANFEFRGIFWATFCYRGTLFLGLFYCFLTKTDVYLPYLAMFMLFGAALGTFFSWVYAKPFLRHSTKVDREWLGKLPQLWQVCIWAPT